MQAVDPALAPHAIPLTRRQLLRRAIGLAAQHGDRRATRRDDSVESVATALACLDVRLVQIDRQVARVMQRRKDRVRLLGLRD